MKLFTYPIFFGLLLYSNIASGQALPSPKEHFGFNIGDDYLLTSYVQTEAYFKKLDALSDRVKLVNIGMTEEGRTQPMLIVTSPENHRKLERIREISIRMARAETLEEDEARELAEEGRAVVWIDGGLHSTETVGSHQLIETIWQIASRNDPETRRILDNVVILFVHANPDGHELVTDWYMRHESPGKRSLRNLPSLYHKYVGHDNNRDFYMFNMKESQNIGRQLFVDWIPQIMYNHHQRGPAGTILAGPPYRDPFNHVFDPLVITGIDAVGAAMYNRLNAENKPGFTRLGGAVFSTWYNGGLRTTTYFHNMIGLLTELAGGPTPEDIALVPDRLIPDNNTPNPALPQKWHFRQSIDYSVSLNYAVLDFAARHRDELLYNIYRMGRNSIERGSRDYWTHYPRRIQELKEAHIRTLPQGSALAHRASIPSKLYDSVLNQPALRDPRGYVIPSSQRDFPTAVKFVNTLIRGGIRVEKASEAFTVNSKSYPKGSFVIKTNQAFRPHLLDMFEPQDYPNDFVYPGGPPVAPYDAAGWTLAYQMGVEFDRFLDDFNGPFEMVPYGEIQKPEQSTGVAGGGFILSSGINDSFLAVNKLLKEGVEVYRIREVKSAVSSAKAGSFYVPSTKKSAVVLQELNTRLGIAFAGEPSKKHDYELERLRNPLRIALWDTYGGSMPSGWMRWLLEQYEFDFDVVYPAQIDAGGLREKYDVIILATRAIPAVGVNPQPAITAEEVPEAHRFRVGATTSAASVPQIKAFAEGGGRVIAIGTSTNLAYHLGLPVWDALTEVTADGRKSLPADKYYIPGSILKVRVDTAQFANSGFGPYANVYFDKSPVFHVSADAVSKGRIKPLAWFEEDPLRSGWAWGHAYLQNGIAAFEAKVGEGSMFAFGPEIIFRAQSHGTFRWLFNQLY